MIHVTSISSNVKKGANAQLKSKVLIVGPNGSGKSSMMMVIGGLERPSAGRVLVGGEDMTGVAPYRRPVNMVFQHLALFEQAERIYGRPALMLSGGMGMPASLAAFSMSAGFTPSSKSWLPSVMNVPNTRLV
mgnify:CR=1 FL=1